MYGTSEVKGDAGSPQFAAGITDNVEITNVAYENSKADGTGKNVLAVHFQGSNGQTFRKIFWEVDAQRTIEMNQKWPRKHTRDNAKIGGVKGETITDDQAVLLAFDEFNRNVKHIMTKYMSEEESVVANASSYQEFANSIVKKMAGKYAGKKMRLKLIYQKNNYLDTPRFGNYLESMDVNPSGLTINVTYDKLTRDEPTEEPMVSAYSDVDDSTGSAITNDLPF